MASLSSYLFLLHPKPFPTRREIGLDIAKRNSTKISASRGDSDDRSYSSGRLVDENLIVLRKRIHERKMLERNYEPPSGWMDWEKSCYPSYNSMICEAMGLLQSCLMNTMPSLALGMAALVARWILRGGTKLTSSSGGSAIQQ